MAVGAIPAQESSLTSEDKILETKWLGLDSGLCWRCGHQTSGRECRFCGRSMRDQLEDFEDFDDPLGPGPSGANIEDPALLDAEPLNTRKTKKRWNQSDELDHDIISPRKRRLHIEERERLVALAWTLLQEEKKKVNSGYKNPLANFYKSDSSGGSPKSSRLPEFKFRQAITQAVSYQKAGGTWKPTVEAPPFEPTFNLEPLDLWNTESQPLSPSKLASAVPFKPMPGVPPLGTLTGNQQKPVNAPWSKPGASTSTATPATEDTAAPPFVSPPSVAVSIASEESEEWLEEEEEEEEGWE